MKNIHQLLIISVKKDIEELKPDIALILNIAEDHLDRYSSFDDYCKAKINLLRNMMDLLLNMMYVQVL